jgi:hypothetical protein
MHNLSQFSASCLVFFSHLGKENLAPLRNLNPCLGFVCKECRLITIAFLKDKENNTRTWPWEAGTLCTCEYSIARFTIIITFIQKINPQYNVCTIITFWWVTHSFQITTHYRDLLVVLYLMCHGIKINMFQMQYNRLLF